MESQYDYGSRAGIWRIYEAFKGTKSVTLHTSYLATDLDHRLQDASHYIRCRLLCQQGPTYGRSCPRRGMGDGESWVSVSRASDRAIITQPSDSYYRWIEHYDLEPEKEKELIREGVKIFQSLSPEVSVYRTL